MSSPTPDTTPVVRIGDRDYNDAEVEALFTRWRFYGAALAVSAAVLSLLCALGLGAVIMFYAQGC